MIRRKIPGETLHRWLLTAGTAAVLYLFLRYDAAAAESAVQAMSSCIRRVIPALFPYMVLSSLILSLDLAAPLCRFLPMHALRLPNCAAPVLITGILGGFPVGAAGCAQLCSEGRLSREQAARLCALSSHTSPAFLIGTVGALWNSKRFGLYLCCVSLIFTLLSAIFLRLGLPSGISSEPPPAVLKTHEKFTTVFCRSVSDAASSCLAVTAFITFFRVLCTVLTAAVPPLGELFALILEFSGGTMYASTVGGITGAAMTGFAVGFSGFSVLAQILRYLTPHEISAVPLAAAKIAEGFVTAAASAWFAWKFPLTPVEDVLLGTPVSSVQNLLIPLVTLVTLHAAGHFLPCGKYFPRRT